MSTHLSLGAHVYCLAENMNDERVFEGLIEHGISAVEPSVLQFTLTIGQTGLPRRPIPLARADAPLRAWRRNDNIGLALLSEDGTLPDVPPVYRSEIHLLRRRPPNRNPPQDARFGDIAFLRTGPTSEGDEQRFVEGALRSFELVEGDCGVIHAASSDAFIRMDVGVARASSSDHNNVENTRLRYFRLKDYEHQLGDLLPGAFWGVMLGNPLVEKLGGLDRIEADAPVHRTLRLANGALYLQATPRPVPITDAVLRSLLPALEEFLEPVSAPIGPYFREILAR